MKARKQKGMAKDPEVLTYVEDDYINGEESSNKWRLSLADEISNIGTFLACSQCNAIIVKGKCIVAKIQLSLGEQQTQAYLLNSHLSY